MRGFVVRRARDGSGRWWPAAALLGLALAAGLAVSVLGAADAAGEGAGGATDDGAFALRAPAYGADARIPVRFTCDGAEHSPPLTWSDPPEGTRSFALLLEDPDAPDPDAPERVWVHWVLYDLPADARSLAEGAAQGGLPRGTRVGRNDWDRRDYGGPCPPVGRHRYVHRLFALDTALGELDGPDRAALRAAMRGHVIARARLVATYARQDAAAPGGS